MADDLSASYAAAGFGGQLAFGTKPALLIVDVVMAYLDPASALYAGVEDALAANERLVAAARAVDVPVIFTNVVYAPDGRDGGMFFRKVPALTAFVRGSWRDAQDQRGDARRGSRRHDVLPRLPCHGDVGGDLSRRCR